MRGLLWMFLAGTLSCVAQTSTPMRPSCPDLDMAKSAGYSLYLGAAFCRVMTGAAGEREIGFAILREEAKSNDEAAYMLSGVLQAAPDSRFRDEVQAVALLEKLAAKGSVRAKGALGSLLLSGHGVEQDTNRAEVLLNEAANANDASATYSLFVEYRKGFRLPRDLARSDALLQRLQKMKGMEASLNLQNAEQIIAREEDDEKTLLSRAESGNHLAQYYVGKRKLDAQEYEEAAQWFQKAADQKFALAVYELAAMYERGLGFEKDPRETVKLYIQAAELGYPPAQIKLAGKYLAGEGVEKSSEHGLFWLKVAALIGSEKAAKSFQAESERVPSPLVSSAIAKAEEYLKLHPEFLTQKDRQFRELRVYPATTSN